MIITVASGKGGVGKSNFVANLGLALSDFGVNTIVVDANLTNGDLGCILGPPFPEKTLHDVLSQEATISEAIFEHPVGVKVIPSSMSVDAVSLVNPREISNLTYVLDDIADLVLVDAPGTLGENTIESLKIADKIVLITTPELTSYSNTLKTKKLAEKHGLDVLGIVINKVRGNSERIIADAENWLESKALCALPYDESVIDSVESGRPAVRHKPYSRYSIAVRKFAAELANVEYEPPHPIRLFLANFLNI
ncbi:MAG: cell division ATPase MinD [Candidatus Micrarchaeia archaeon]